MFSRSRNSHFQYLYFIAGKCHTADEAYRIIRDQWDTVDQALRSAEAGKLRAAAKKERARRVLEQVCLPKPEMLEAKADLAELEASEPQFLACIEEAQRERAFLEKLMATLEPHRKYRHLPDHEAMQAIQREEWGLELVRRAENFLLAQNGIPADHVEAMRQHPDFERAILPRLMQMIAARAQGKLVLSPPPAFLEEAAKLLPSAEPFMLPTPRTTTLQALCEPTEKKS